MNDVAFCSVAFGDRRYIDQMKRLKESILQIYPDAHLFFWQDEMPPGSHIMSQSMYGFKPHAVKYAWQQEFRKIIWFDPACILVDKVDYWFDELIGKYGVVAAQDDNLLANFCGNLAYVYFDISREESRRRQQHLVGGSVYVFNMESTCSRDIFETWYKAEQDGIFGKDWDFDHRNDESVMALSLYHHVCTPTPYDECRYNNVSRPLVVKKHFK